MTNAVQRYLEEVLGVRSVLMPTGSLKSKVLFLVEKENYHTAEQELLQKIAQAMKLKDKDFKVSFEWSEDSSNFNEVVAFGDTWTHLSSENSNCNVTHSLSQLITNPQQKRDTWNLMQSVMGRFT